MKKTLVTVLSFILSLSVLMPNVYAAEKDKSQKEKDNYIDGKNLSKDELKKIRESNQNYSIELTTQQAAERVAEINGITVEEAYQEMPGNSDNDTKNVSGIAPLATTATSSTCGWVETRTTLTIPNKSYKPTLIVIPEVCYGGGAKWINTTKKPWLQEMMADTKRYSGTIKVELYAGNFVYLVNGSFYNSGATTHSGTTGATTVFTATYTISSTSDFYASLYTGRLKRDVLGY